MNRDGLGAHRDAGLRRLSTLTLSSGGSTGPGLDIARRIAESSGGTLTLGRSPHGGGAVTIGLGPGERLARRPRRHIKTRQLEPGPAPEDD